MLINTIKGKQESLKPGIGFLTLGALGVVYGDIGTSPLYALRIALQEVPLNAMNILGILSLIVWTLLIIITVKYVLITLRADNEGEGGTLALLALLKAHSKKSLPIFLLLAIFGTGLLLGDGMLTPAISVLSAIEGLEVIEPKFSYLVLPVAIIILGVLFWNQRHGSSKIGIFFGPLMVLWFLTIGTLGLLAIVKNPMVLKAVNPKYAITFIIHNTSIALAVLGGVFLVTTGGEALYADLGHFGPRPIQLGWFCLVLPGLVLNYFGQGALLLQQPSAIANPFYSLAPDWFMYPLLILATLSTIIASQAVISAVFSLARQAVLLDLFPEIQIIQTSAYQQGQIYVPLMNVILALGTISLVLAFESSNALAASYGIAVNLDMLTVTILLPLVASQIWRWPRTLIIFIFGSFFCIEMIFLAANCLKILSGGWIPLTIALISAVIMMSWYKGVHVLREIFYQNRPELTEMVGYLQQSTKVQLVPDLTAVFITDAADISGGSLLHYLKLNYVLPGCVIILSVVTEDIPYVMETKRYEFQELGQGFYRLILHYGFMQLIDVPKALDQINKRKELPFQINSQQVTFFTEAKNIIPSRRKQKYFWSWQKKLFAYLQHNSLTSIEFYKLPINRTIAIGVYCEI